MQVHALLSLIWIIFVCMSRHKAPDNIQNLEAAVCSERNRQRNIELAWVFHCDMLINTNPTYTWYKGTRLYLASMIHYGIAIQESGRVALTTLWGWSN